MRSIILVAGLLPACTAPNPAFDVSGQGTTSAATTSTGSSGRTDDHAADHRE